MIEELQEMIESGELTKNQLVSIAEEAARAISTKNHKDAVLQGDI